MKGSQRTVAVFLMFALLFYTVVSCMGNLGARISQEHEILTSTDAESDYPTVIIDAGHGGEDGGAIGVNGVLEKDLNLQIAILLEEMLRALGYDTVMTRTEDVLLYDRNENYEGRKKVLDLAARLAIGKQYENAVFISIHMNAFPQEQYRGLQVYYSDNDPRSASLATEIQELSRELLMPSNHRRIKPSNGNVYLLDRATIPAVLVECGFLSNPSECEDLSSETYRRKMATVLFAAVDQYLNKENVEES